jgi:hypothetical protein
MHSSTRYAALAPGTPQTGQSHSAVGARFHASKVGFMLTRLSMIKPAIQPLNETR